MNDIKASVSSTRRSLGASGRGFWLNLNNLEVPEILPELLRIGRKNRVFADVLEVTDRLEALWCYFDLLEELLDGS